MDGKPLLIAKTGDTIDAIRTRYGDYDWMFSQCIDGLEIQTVQAHRQPELLPDHNDICGLIVTGSPFSVTEPQAWTKQLSAWMIQATNPALLLL